MSRDERGLFHLEEPSAESGTYGCPMLVRGRGTISMNNGGAFWRCSLGWAIRGEDDAACCQATGSVDDCWKVHPDRKPDIAGKKPVTVEQKAVAD